MQRVMFFQNDWIEAVKHTLLPNTAFIISLGVQSNQQQTSYMVYTAGTVIVENADKSFVLVRNAGDTTDSSVINDTSQYLTVETEDEVAEFFCVSKKSKEKVDRIEHRLNAGDVVTAANNLVFVAIGDVVINGKDVAGPQFFDNASGATITAVSNAFVAEVF